MGTSCLTLAPFTLDHFRAWATDLVLDTDEPWLLEPYQEDFLADIFAGFKTVWLVVPEGNGKTTTLAGLALYHCQHKPSGWVPVAASSREQAQIMYRQAEGFVFRSPTLSQVFKAQEGMRRIKCDSMGSRIQILAADERTGDGIIPTLGLVDELHRHRNLGLYRTWQGKLDKRQGQLAVISTAGEPGSEFEETREQMRQEAVEVERAETFVRAVGKNSVLHDWAVPENGDVEDFELVAQANPFSGVTEETLREKFELPGMTIAHWRRFTCNLPTRSEFAAVEEAEWHQAATAERIPEGQPVWLGLDVAWKWDTTALVPLWIRDPEFRLFGPAVVLEPPRDGTSLDPHLVEHALVELNARNPLECVVMDTSKAEQLGEWIREEFGCEVVDRQQTNPLAALDYARFMEALRNGWLRHTGDPALTRHVLNAVARMFPDGGARFDRPHRSRLGSEQDRRVVDALTAAAMVHSTMSAGVEELQPFVL